MKFEFSRQIIEKISFTYFMKIRPVGPKLFHAGQTDKRTGRPTWQNSKWTNGQADRHDETQNRYSQIIERGPKTEPAIHILRGKFGHYHRHCRPTSHYFVAKNHNISWSVKLLVWNWYRNNHNNFGAWPKEVRSSNSWRVIVLRTWKLGEMFDGLQGRTQGNLLIINGSLTVYYSKHLTAGGKCRRRRGTCHVLFIVHIIKRLRIMFISLWETTVRSSTWDNC